MRSGYYSLAGMTVHVTSLYDEVHDMCRDYATEPKSDCMEILTSEADIEYESRVSDEERELEGLPPYTFAAPYLETLAVYRKIAEKALEHNVMLLHGSVIAVDGEGYMFTAASGTGKSTHVRLWRELFGDRAVMINDDKPLIDVTEPRVYGTPWDGKHHLSTNTSVPLKAICILERGRENSIEKLTVEEAASTIIQQSYRPRDMRQMQLMLAQLAVLMGKVAFYRLRCNMDPSAARLSYGVMSGREV